MDGSPEHYLRAISENFTRHQNSVYAGKMKAYMRNQFEFLGIKSPERKSLQREIYKEFGKPDKENTTWVVENLWQMPEREFQYFAMDILDRAVNKLRDSSIALIEDLIITKSWWDTVDFLAARVAGKYFKIYPERIQPVTGRWMDSGNLWLQRSCLLFQLKYKHQTDVNLLYRFIDRLKNSNEFFIKKAIGWVLREYSKTDPVEVERYVKEQKLKALSQKEALKVIESKRNHAKNQEKSFVNPRASK